MSESLRILFGKDTYKRLVWETQEQAKIFAVLKPDIGVELIDMGDLDDGRHSYPVAMHIVDSVVQEKVVGIVPMVELILRLKK